MHGRDQAVADRLGRHHFPEVMTAAVLAARLDGFAPVRLDSGAVRGPDVGDNLNAEQQHELAGAAMALPGELVNQALGRLAADRSVDQPRRLGANAGGDRAGEVVRPAECPLAARH